MTDTCGVCHRPLLDPESRAAGIGPVCAEKFHPPHGRRTAGPDQLTFEEHHVDDTATPDCTSWLVTPQTITAVDDAVDAYGTYAKGFFECVNGRTTVVGLRVGSGSDRVVARFGDTLVRHPDGRWSVRSAPALAEEPPNSPTP
ncbi:DUF6011 domain-containing protein [Streptomyces sp. BE230]|uniref:DUF6011 domain-containing protein n=1 Tax=Streptomyces sp. BE230 TaxID=3002526 RepID=UPI002ED48FC8|nr:DUF6011 domain-containing protein [Streptomyces sp. BE230]